jgi:hypothetical protein
MKTVWLAARDFAELFFWPLSIALLPWPAGFRVAQFVARRRWFFEDSARAALSAARIRLQVGDDADWLYRYRFTRLMDHADLYLSMTRSRAWLEKSLVRHGEWPVQKPVIGMTFHWGNGLFALRSMQHSTGPFAGVALAVDKALFRGRPVQYAYVKLRNWETARAIGGGLNYTGDAARRFVAALRRGTSICGLFDVPPTPLVKARKADFLGGEAWFPRGAVRLATAHRVALVIFRSTVDPVSGRREIWIESPATDADETILFERAVRNLEEAVKMQPAAWHLWGALGAFSGAAVESGHPPL